MAKKITRHASALKAKRQNIVQRTRNQKVRSRARHFSANVLKAIAAKNADEAHKQFKLAQSAWMKAAKRKAFHKNAANRHISRLTSQLATLAKS